MDRRAEAFTLVELVSTYLARIESLDPQLNAFLTICGDEALAAATIAEERVTQDEALGALHVISIPIKNLHRTAGIRTTRGSLIFKDDVPETDDLVVARIRSAGAIIIGKANTLEFGHRDGSIRIPAGFSGVYGLNRARAGSVPFF